MKDVKRFLISFMGIAALYSFMACSNSGSDDDDGAGAKDDEIEVVTPDENVTVDERSVLIRDSDTGIALANAQIVVNRSNGTTVVTLSTNSSGIASFPSSLSLADGDYIFVISRDGYIRTTDTISITGGGIANGNQISIPKQSSEDCIKIILDWGVSPRDIDSHLWLGNYHVYFSNKSAADGDLQLDRDDVDSYGPETVTIRNVDASATYNYYVHNFSEYPDLTTSEARVRVYVNNVYRKTYTVPTSGTDFLWWHVFDITNGSTIVDGSGLTSTYPSY